MSGHATRLAQAGICNALGSWKGILCCGCYHVGFCESDGRWIFVAGGVCRRRHVLMQAPGRQGPRGWLDRDRDSDSRVVFDGAKAWVQASNLLASEGRLGTEEEAHVDVHTGNKTGTRWPSTQDTTREPTRECTMEEIRHQSDDGNDVRTVYAPTGPCACDGDAMTSSVFLAWRSLTTPTTRRSGFCRFCERCDVDGDAETTVSERRRDDASGRYTERTCGSFDCCESSLCAWNLSH